MRRGVARRDGKRREKDRIEEAREEERGMDLVGDGEVADRCHLRLGLQLTELVEHCHAHLCAIADRLRRLRRRHILEVCVGGDGREQWQVKMGVWHGRAKMVRDAPGTCRHDKHTQTNGGFRQDLVADSRVADKLQPRRLCFLCASGHWN